MPLYGKGKGMIGQFHGFHQPIGRVTRDPQGSCDILQPLMVVAIDTDDRLAQHVGDARAFLDFHLMDEHVPQISRVGMIEGTR